MFKTGRLHRWSAMLMLMGIISGILICYAATCHASENENPEEKKAEIRLLTNEIDFGTIHIDSEVEDSVRFVNIGNAPLVIKSAFSNCGCTVPEYPHAPIMPSDTATIRIKYKSIDKLPGSFRKIVRIRTNATTPTVSIYISGKTRLSD